MAINLDSYAQEVDKKFIRNATEPPEMHIHAAVTFVIPGRLEAPTPMERRDKAWEAGQFVVKIEQIQVANLKRLHIDAAMRALRDQILKRIRDCGGLKAGD